MTRINVVPVEELTDKHLLAEYHELPRVFTLVKNAVAKGKTPADFDIPENYVLGKGHVTFFYNKLWFVRDRHHALESEIRARGFDANPFLASDIRLSAETSIPNASCEHDAYGNDDGVWWNDYSPTDSALKINRERIAERLSGII